jgi:hypothetical protein
MLFTESVPRIVIKTSNIGVEPKITSFVTRKTINVLKKQDKKNHDLVP